MNIFQKIIKTVTHTYIAAYIKCIEKTYRNNDTRLKYLWFDSKKHHENGSLVVIFQACNTTPIYNYVRTFKDLDVCRLYIKDDFGTNQRGSYYLGEKGRGNVEKTVIELIDKYKNEKKIKRIICVGSSKGGYSAINFSLEFDEAIAIVASPQYYLASYLNSAEDLRVALEDILGQDYCDSQKLQDLDNRLHNKIVNSNKNNEIRLLYSTKEGYTYDKHISHMITDIKNSNITLSEYRVDYEKHWDLYKYFPSYLIQEITKIIDQ